MGRLDPRMDARTPYSAHDGLVRVYPAARPHVGTALVWSHGGAFAGGDLEMPEAHWVATTLADAGVTVVSVDYRRASSTIRYPEPSDDVLSAYRWTRGAASDLGIDADRIVIGGASAGANLTAGVALRLHDGPGPLPWGVFLAYPTLHAVQPPPAPALAAAVATLPTELVFDDARIRSMYEVYLGTAVEEAPLVAVPGEAKRDDLVGLPPVLIINDDVDALRASGEAFADALRAAGVAVESHIAVGTTHGHLNRPELPQASATVALVLDWITRLPHRDRSEALHQ
ncbi:alpha/beta hydrolase [Microcella sp.]|uniref:alpha/beta hydrolase n=1 Tax=Microcella sp. TaxID=1913979 RepID=UPI003F70CDD2